MEKRLVAIYESGDTNYIDVLLKSNDISEFLSKGILPVDKLDKYYALSNDDLKSMELDITNEENSYYIVNYEENTVFITAGYTNENEEEIVYKLD